MGKHRAGCSTAAKLDAHWINARFCPAHRTLSVSGGLWGCGLASAGLDAGLLHDDWMICLRLNPFLIDSEMSESAILKYKQPPDRFSSFIPLFRVDLETLQIILVTFSLLKAASDKSNISTVY